MERFSQIISWQFSGGRLSFTFVLFSILLPDGHMAAFTHKGTAQSHKITRHGVLRLLSKKKKKKTYSNHEWWCNPHHIQRLSQFGGSGGRFRLIHLLHLRSHVICFTLQWLPLIYFSTRALKFPTRVDRASLSQNWAQCIFQKRDLIVFCCKRLRERVKLNVCAQVLWQTGWFWGNQICFEKC